MNVKSSSSKVKAVALVFLVGCSGWSSAALAEGAARQSNIIHDTSVATMDSSSAGYELDYFHAYKTSKTYAIRLKNGLQASFDFNTGTATIYDGVNHTSVPLEDVLLQANNGNVQAAAEMFEQMYQSIAAANSDSIMAHEGTQGYGAYWFPPPPPIDGSIGDLDGNLWMTPGQGQCWPVPTPCNEWAGGLSNWGAYNQWWNNPFGTPPPTTQPPRPDGCSPGDIDCIVWEHDRENACGELFQDNATLYGLDASVGYVCATAATGAGALACLGSLVVYAGAQYKLQKDTKKCHTPYPG